MSKKMPRAKSARKRRRRKAQALPITKTGKDSTKDAEKPDVLLGFKDEAVRLKHANTVKHLIHEQVHQTPSNQQVQRVLAQLQTEVTNDSMCRAIEQNRYWRTQLGWAVQQDKIVAFLQERGMLPPLQSPVPALFADGVKQYQGQEGLSDDGVIGPKTWQHLRQEMNGSARAQLTSIDPQQTKADAENTPLQANAQSQWEAHPAVHRHFNNSFDRYSQLLPLYQARGVQNPAAYIENNIIEVSFYGRRTPAHQDMAAPLAEAEAALQEQNFDSDIQRFWSFNARASSSGRLSQHAVGRAVDINPPENPFIQNSIDIEVIRAVTGVNLGEPQDAETSRQASLDFQANFTQDWIDQQSAALKRKIRRRQARLELYAQNGFMNLQQSLIDAFVNAGFVWGGNWNRSKDYMHFEIGWE